MINLYNILLLKTVLDNIKEGFHIINPKFSKRKMRVQDGLFFKQKNIYCYKFLLCKQAWLISKNEMLKSEKIFMVVGEMGDKIMYD